MLRIAVEEGAMPSAAIAGLQELGYSLWHLPRGTAEQTRRLIAEFPPDIVVLPLEPRAADAVSAAAERMPTLRVIASAEGGRELDLQPSWADFVVPRTSDPVLWMLSVMALHPESGEQGPSGWRRTLLTVIDRTHQAFRSIDSRRGDTMIEELRARLEEAFELLLRIMLDRMERDIVGFAGHSARVADLSRRVGDSMGMAGGEAGAVGLAGLLHDLGMHLVVPTGALSRRGPLHRGEWEVLRSHPIASAAIVSPLLSADRASTAIREHHERLDGSGYPFNKRGDEISIEARIVTVADAFEAMTHPRPHRTALTTDRALDALSSEAAAGRLDPDVCRTLASVVGARSG